MPIDQGTSQTPKFELPPELLSELQRRGAPRRHDFAVESWQPSIFERLLAMLTGRK